MVRADVHRVPLRHFARREDDDVAGQPQRGAGREDISAARQVFLDDVVLCRALQRGARRALFVGGGDVEREQPRRRSVDRHRRVHVGERDAVEQHAHVAEMGDRHADLADLAPRQQMVRIVARLRRQIEGDREARLPLAEILAEQLVGGRRGRMARIGAENPRFVFAARARVVAHGGPREESIFAKPSTHAAKHNRRKGEGWASAASAPFCLWCSASFSV